MEIVDVGADILEAVSVDGPATLVEVLNVKVDVGVAARRVLTVEGGGADALDCVSDVEFVDMLLVGCEAVLLDVRLGTAEEGAVGLGAVTESDAVSVGSGLTIGTVLFGPLSVTVTVAGEAVRVAPAAVMAIVLTTVTSAV